MTTCDYIYLFALQATPTDPPSSPEIFLVSLYVQSLSLLPARLAEGRGVAAVEPRGVIKLKYQSFSEREGATVSNHGNRKAHPFS